MALLTERKGTSAPRSLAAAPTAAAVTATEATPSTIGEPTTQQSAGQGEVTVQVFTCPPGMTAESLAAAVCEPVADGFDLALAGEALAEPLTVQDADMRGNAVTWSGLPPGDYVISEPQLPAGATTYVLSALTRYCTGQPLASSRFCQRVSSSLVPQFQAVCVARWVWVRIGSSSGGRSVPR